MDKEKEQSRFIIQRFDNYINGVNTKGNFLLAFNTFLCGGIVSNYSSIIEMIDCPTHYKFVNISMVLLVLFSLVTTLFIIKAVYPFLNSGNSSIEKYHSHIFFNSVAEFKVGKDFYNSFSNQTDKEVEEDLAIQAHQLAQGLKTKFFFIEWAMKFVYLELLTLAFLFLLIILY